MKHILHILISSILANESSSTSNYSLSFINENSTHSEVKQKFLQN